MSVPYYGDISEDATIHLVFNTFDSNDPSASVTATDLVDADVKVHKDAGTTPIATDGATVSVNFASVTGCHMITIDTSVHADYAVGSNYSVRVEGITVDAATLNPWVGTFSIENREPHVKTALILTDTEAIITDTETGITERGTLLTDTEAILGDTNELQTDWTNAGRLDAILDAVLVDTETVATVISDTEAILSDTELVLTDTEAVLVDTEALGASGLTPLGSGTAQSGTASTIVLAAVDAFADNVLNGNSINITSGTGAGQARIITTNTLADDTCNVTPNWTTNPSSDSVYEIVQGSANITAVVQTAQTAGDIIADTELVLVDSEAIISDTELVLTDAEAIVADTNELQVDWTNAGRLDAILDAVLVDTETVATVITDTEAILSDTELVLTDTEAILTDTNELQTDWTNAGRLDAILDAILVDTEALGVGSGLTALATGTAQSGTASTIVLAAAASFADNILNGNIIKIHTGTGAGQARVILSNTLADDTCNISPNWTTNPSSDSQYEIIEGSVNIVAVSNVAEDVATETNVNTAITDTEAILIDSEAIIVDTEANTAVLTDTEQLLTDASTIITDTEAIVLDTNELQVDWTNAGRLDAILDAILVDTEAATGVITDTEAILTDSEAIISDTELVLTDTEAITPTYIENAVWDALLTGSSHNTATSAGRRLREIEEAFVHASGTIATVTDGRTITLDAGAVGTADYYIGDRLQITEGVGAGQSRIIVAYSAAKVCLLDYPFTTNPNTASLYSVDSADVWASVTDADLAEGQVATYTNTTTITLDTGAVGTANYYVGELIVFTHGTGSGQSREITGYTAGRVVTMAPALATALDTTTTYHIQANVSIPEIVAELEGGTTLPALLTDTEAVLVDTEAATGVIADTEAIIADSEAILTDTEAATGVITDTEAILTDTEAAITERSTLLTDTEAVLTDSEAIITDAEAIIADTELVEAVTTALGSAAAAQLNLSANQIITFTVDTVVNTHTPTTTEFQADDITEATADHYNGRIIVWTTGALAGQATDITDYALVTTIGQFTVTAMTEAPANNDTGIIL
jgi:hypothetical protein